MSKSVGNMMNCYPQSPPVLGSSGLSNLISPPWQTFAAYTGTVWSRSSWELLEKNSTPNPNGIPRGIFLEAYPRATGAKNHTRGD